MNAAQSSSTLVETALPAGVDPAAATLAVSAVMAGRRARVRRRTIVGLILLGLVVGIFALTLMVGRTFYTPDEVLRVILGERVSGASFTVGELRLPRSVTAVMAGFAFGVAGVTFQTMLRNPLASPDIIGISAGASAAAVVGIVLLGLGDTAVSLLALGGALVTATVIYFLSYRGGFAGSRLILIGIGVAAILTSVITFALSRAATWDLQTAMQWLTGSLNGSSWARLLPLAIAFVVLLPVLIANNRNLTVLRLGDDSAASLGVPVSRTRLMVILAAVALLAFATASVGPIVFLAFMAGPIAARLVGPGASLVLPAGMVGAILVLASDLAGQFAFDNRYPVGVITGVLGAPYLIYLLIRTNRSGGAL